MSFAVFRPFSNVLMRSSQQGLQNAVKVQRHCAECYLCRYLSCSGSHTHPCTQTALTGPVGSSNRILSKQHTRFYAQIPHKATDKSSQTTLISWRSVLATLLVGGGVLGSFQYIKRRKELEMEKERNRLVGKAAIGGPFNLIDHTGKPKSNTDYFGKWVLLYFGFTHCPDICPDELEKMVAAVDKINKRVQEKDRVIPIFITIDPERDSVEAVAAYVKEFSPNMIGLTGSKEQVEEAAKGYRVYHSQGPKDDDNDYIVDHTIIMYLLGPDGNFVNYFGQNTTDDDIANSITSHIKKHNRLQKL